MPIGVTAAKKQSPLLMHLEYRVSLPDHDWVVAEKHKLIPSVYAGIEIREKGMGKPEAVTYSGPTYIAIRSGKHSSSTAATHADDLDTLLHMDIFRDLARDKEGNVKPIIIITVDGGPDENPRYNKTILQAVKHFKKYNLDAIFVVANSPGRSAYNRVERRMAPLSKELTGIVLPHEEFGSHLDSQKRTIDPELELRNFTHAGKVLAEIWSSVTIDGYPVEAEFVPPTPEELQEDSTEEFSSPWYAKHVRESQYMLQIIKCGEEECCGAMRSKIKLLLPDMFLPPPIKLCEESLFPTIANQSDIRGQFLGLLARRALTLEIEDTKFKQPPYDYFCPSVQSQLAERICKSCDLYFASKKSLAKHIKDLHKNQERAISTRVRVKKRLAAKRCEERLCIIGNYEDSENDDAEWLDEEDILLDSNADSEQILGGDSVVGTLEVGNLKEWLINPWTEDK